MGSIIEDKKYSHFIGGNLIFFLGFKEIVSDIMGEFGKK